MNNDRLARRIEPPTSSQPSPFAALRPVFPTVPLPAPEEPPTAVQPPDVAQPLDEAEPVLDAPAQPELFFEPLTEAAAFDDSAVEPYWEETQPLTAMVEAEHALFREVEAAVIGDPAPVSSEPAAPVLDQPRPTASPPVVPSPVAQPATTARAPADAAPADVATAAPAPAAAQQSSAREIHWPETDRPITPWEELLTEVRIPYQPIPEPWPEASLAALATSTPAGPTRPVAPAAVEREVLDTAAELAATDDSAPWDRPADDRWERAEQQPQLAQEAMAGSEEFSAFSQLSYWTPAPPDAGQLTPSPSVPPMADGPEQPEEADLDDALAPIMPELNGSAGHLPSQDPRLDLFQALTPEPLGEREPLVAADSHIEPEPLAEPQPVLASEAVFPLGAWSAPGGPSVFGGLFDEPGSDPAREPGIQASEPVPSAAAEELQAVSKAAVEAPEVDWPPVPTGLFPPLPHNLPQLNGKPVDGPELAIAWPDEPRLQSFWPEPSAAYSAPVSAAELIQREPVPPFQPGPPAELPASPSLEQQFLPTREQQPAPTPEQHFVPAPEQPVSPAPELPLFPTDALSVFAAGELPAPVPAAPDPLPLMTEPLPLVPESTRTPEPEPTFIGRPQSQTPQRPLADHGRASRRAAEPPSEMERPTLIFVDAPPQAYVFSEPTSSPTTHELASQLDGVLARFASQAGTIAERLPDTLSLKGSSSLGAGGEKALTEVHSPALTMLFAMVVIATVLLFVILVTPLLR